MSACCRCYLLYVALAVWVGTTGLEGCATCFGASDDPMAQGMNLGILTLMGVILAVMVGVAGFFVFLAVRASRVPAGGGWGDSREAAEEWGASWRS